MHLLYGFFVVINIGFNINGENDMSKKIDLVDVLKQNLRRNNDDYTEMEKNKVLNSSKTNPITTMSKDLHKYGKGVKAGETKNSITSGVKRRAGGGHYFEFDYSEIKTASSSVDKKPDNLSAVTKDPLTVRGIAKPTINQIHHIKRNISRLNNRDRIDSQILNSTKAKVIKNNKKRIDKFKKFISKNRALFKGVLSNDVEAQANKVKLKGKDNILRNEMKESQRDEADEDGEIPSPDMLDMAPAKGGRIYRLRAKGRLCYRHVLLPEGPKYDSNGRWYVPEHRLVARRPYDATPRPRCCNCCKKSVLGCE